jgi:hypothetical protein
MTAVAYSFHLVLADWTAMNRDGKSSSSWYDWMGSEVFVHLQCFSSIVEAGNGLLVGSRLLA